MASAGITSDMQLDLMSATPLYRQLADALSTLIANSTLKPGDSMPTEDELCERFEVSRSTVRKAYAELVAAGRVVRRPRKGTVVAEPKLPRNLDTLYNFSSEINKLGLTPTSRILGFEVTTPPS